MTSGSGTRHRPKAVMMGETIDPDATCAVQGCDEPVANTTRSPTAAEVVDVPPGEIVGLCATHAEQANEPERPEA